MANRSDAKSKQPAEMKQGGRPSTYNAELAHEICRRMAEGEILAQICREEGMPAASTVRGWALDDREGFAALYSRARELLVHGLADDILEIADDSTGDIRKAPDGREAVDTEIVQRSRLRVDSRKWLMARLLPKVYGDKLDTTNTTLGADGKPVDPQRAVVLLNVIKGKDV